MPLIQNHDNVIKWKYFPRYWPFVRGIHRYPVNSPHKGQWRGTLMFSFDLRLNKRSSKQSWGWWLETLSRPLWRHCNDSPSIIYSVHAFTGDPLHSRAACTQPCNVNTHSRAHCSPGARLCEQWGRGCVNNGARLCASARLCRGSPVALLQVKQHGSIWQNTRNRTYLVRENH